MLRYTARKLSVEYGENHLLRIAFDGKPLLYADDLFRLEWREGEEQHVLTARDMQAAACPNPCGLTLCFKAEGQQVCAVLEVRNGRIEMRANAVLSHGAICCLHYPLLHSAGPVADTTEEDRMVVPWQNGFVVRNPAKNLIARETDQPFWAGRGVRKYENDYPAQFSFQFLYWYGPRGGLYLCTEDGEARFKTFGLYSRSDTLFDLAVIHYPEDAGETAQYALPYPVVLQGLEGDWQQAAGVYRTWATAQKWCAHGKLQSKKQDPRLYDIDLWRINHRHQQCGWDYAEYLDTALALTKGTGARLGQHWYGWNHTPHDVHYPEYVRQEDKPEIYAALRKLNEEFDRHGIVKIPYVNGRIVDRSNDHYAAFGLDPYLIRDEGGDVHEEVWNDVADMAPVCPGTGYWQEMVRDFCLEYQKQCGFDGFYIDQIGSFFATRCYDRSHGHPLGGGSWWNESYHQLIRKVRDVLGDDKILTTESCCESYIDVMDMMLILDQDMILDGSTMLAGMRHQQPIPLFNMIYGDYSMSYGSSDHFDIPQPQFSYALVRNLLWGFVPTIEGVTARQLERADAGERMDVLRQVTAFYHENKDVFFGGRLCRLPEIQGAARTAELPCNLYGPYAAELPELLAAQWEDATGTQHLFCYSFAAAGARFTVDGREIAVPKQGFFEMQS